MTRVFLVRAIAGELLAASWPLWNPSLDSGTSNAAIWLLSVAVSLTTVAVYAARVLTRPYPEVFDVPP